jgi:integrase
LVVEYQRSTARVQAKLTQKTVDSLRPREKLYWVRDPELKGFQLSVRPNGRMAWFFDYRNAVGRRLTYKLGNYPGLKPEGARRSAIAAAGKVADRIDIQAEAQAARIEAERAKVSALGAFIRDRYEPWALQHLRRGDVAVARLKADFKRWLEEPLSSFNSWRIESWRRERLKEETKPNTINRQLDTLRACLRKAVDWGVIEKHPMQGVKRLKVDDDERVRYLSAAEETRLREALAKRDNSKRERRARFNEWREARNKELLPPKPAGYVDHMHPLILVALNTGLRRGELFSLRWSDIDLDGAMLTVRAAAAKSGDSRRVPLNAEARTVLRAWNKQQKPGEEAFVFPGEGGERLTNCNKSWSAVVKSAKLTNFRLHDLRHSFASKLVQAGVDLNTVRALMGHSDIAMTLRYGHLSPDNLRLAVEKIAL